MLQFDERVSHAYILKASLVTPTIPQKNMNFPKNCPKMPQNGPKMTPNGPNMTQMAQNGPRMTQNDPKWPKNDARIYALFPQFFLSEKAVP